MLILPKAILFDMDGTLTRPVLDFPAIKAEMGIGDRPILEALAEMTDDDRRRAEAILLRHECQAATASTLAEGCESLLAWLDQRGVQRALITRNSRDSVATVLARHGMKFQVLISREDGKFKPDPEPVLLACRRLGIVPADAWMVGDGYHDIEAGNAAGAPTVWISHGRVRQFAAEPWRTVRDLLELTVLLEECQR